MMVQELQPILINGAWRPAGSFQARDLATGHSCFTAAGLPASLPHFAARHSYDNVREPRPPPELRDRNPNGQMWRRIDGEWTPENVGAAPRPWPK